MRVDLGRLVTGRRVHVTIAVEGETARTSSAGWTETDSAEDGSIGARLATGAVEEGHGRRGALAAAPSAATPSVAVSAEANRALEDLRAPLAALVTLAHFADRRWERLEEPERRDLVGQIGMRGVELDRLLNDLAQLAQLQSGALELQPAAHSLLRHTERAIDILKPLLRSHDLVIEIPEDLDVMVDPIALRPMVGQLVANAVRFSPEGSVIGVVAREAGDEVHVGVIDEGSGIPPEDRPHIFERFFRGSNATGPGSGVGLWIAQNYAVALGGELWAESEEGEGSAFWFSVPRARQSPRAEERSPIHADDRGL